MGDFVKLLLDSIAYVWPLRLVHTWELGGYYIFGRCYWIVKPGLYPVLPWFMDVKTISVARAIVGTGRQDVTLQDGNTLSFAATVWAKVVDARRALNEVDEPHSTTQELLASVLADNLAEIKPERMKTQRRASNLFKELEDKVATEALEYGVEVTDLRFTSFVLNVKTHRLLIDQTPVMNWT